MKYIWPISWVVILIYASVLSLYTVELKSDISKWKRIAFESDYRPVKFVPMEEDKVLGLVIIQKGKDEAENMFFPFPKKLNFLAMQEALDILGTTNKAELDAIKQKYGIK